jgi:apolipoprotein N-acyltransferase
MKRSYTWLVAGMLLFLVSNGNWTLPIAAWLAPIFLLRSLRTQKALPGLAILFGLFAIAACFMVYGIVPVAVGPSFYGIAVYYGFLWFVPYLLDRLLVGKDRGFAMTLVFPAAAVVAEYLHGLMFGTWTSVAYTQSGNLPLLQMMSVTGLWGVTFIVMWLGPVANWAWERNWKLEEVRRGLAGYGAVVLVVLLAGQARLAFAPASDDTLRVAAVLSMTEMRDFGPDMEAADQESKGRASLAYFESMLEKGRREARSGARVIVWPELIGRIPEDAEPEALRLASEFAREERVELLVAYFVYPPDFPDTYGRNKAVLLTANGEVAWDYVKSALVPGMKEIPGDWILPTHDSDVGKLSAAICYDMDFPHLIGQAGANGVELMLVPAWDWPAINPLHAEMAVYRAIENGFSIVRSTAQGTSIAVDSYGRVLARMDEFTSEDDVMVAQVPARSTWTLYSLIGDVFAWLCSAGLVLVIGIAVFSRARR